MKFVILDNKEIPGYGGVRGPIMTPTAYDLHAVLKWITYEIDIREVMSDGSYRKLQFNDERIMKEIDEELNKKRFEEDKYKEVGNLAKPKQLMESEIKLKKEKHKHQKTEPAKKEEIKKDDDSKNTNMLVIDELENID